MFWRLLGWVLIFLQPKWAPVWRRREWAFFLLRNITLLSRPWCLFGSCSRNKGSERFFNLIGPLLNPARPECQLVGVFDRTLCPIFAEILQRLGRDSAWVVNGATADGRVVDEVSLMGPTLVCKSGNFQGQVDEELQPSDFGLEVVPATELQGGDAAENAVILEEILSGQERGPKRDIVRLNAAAAIACAGLADDMGDAFKKTGEILDNGAALDRLRVLQDYGKIS